MYFKQNVYTLALAILFAMAFSLSVAFCFISAARDTLTTDSTTETTTQSTAQEPEPEEPLQSLLMFTSNQNGTCELSSIGYCTDASVSIPTYSPAGDLVTSIAPRAFYGCPTVTAIQIPASVAFIGNLAFADCKSLSYISVSPDNLAYRAVDGVLYSADMSVLILYPPRRAGTAYRIAKDTTAIREMAFYDCVYLKSIQYAGSAVQWEEISIGAKNYALLAMSKEFGVK